MKIIDLLNKIAKGEEVPKKIKLDGKEYEFNKTYEQYHQTYFGINLLEHISDYNYSGLNDEIEIIEDKEYEDIEKIPYHYNFGLIDCGDLKREVVEELSKNFNYFTDKINALIRNQKYILEQLNKEGK